jgi:hypothetical protein
MRPYHNSNGAALYLRCNEPFKVMIFDNDILKREILVEKV